MGRVEVDQSAQRLRIFLVRLAASTAIEEGGGIEAAATVTNMRKLEEWCEDRK